MVSSVPDFRTLCGDKPSTEVFDISVHDSNESTQQYHKMCVELFYRATEAQPTAFNHLLSDFRQSDRRSCLHLRRHFTQNIDCIETANAARGCRGL